MNVRWERIIAIVLLSISAVLAVKLRPFLRHIIEVTNEPWGWDSPIKAIMLGVLCLTFLTAIQLLIRRRDDDR